MPINLISKIKPKNNGQFPVYEDIDVQGGFQVRSTILDRDNIPTLNRKEGMLVYVVSDGYFYQLGSGLTNIDWTIASFNNAIVNGPAFFPDINSLKNFDPTLLSDGYLAFVASNLSTYQFIKSASSFSDDPINFLIVSSNYGPVDCRWFRYKEDHPIWLSNTDFYINQSIGSNENSGILNTSPIYNWQELYRRIGNNPLQNNINITIDGYLIDEIIINPIWTKNNFNININGTLNQLTPGIFNLTATTQRNRSSNTALGLNKSISWDISNEKKIAKFSGLYGDSYGLLLSIDPLNSNKMWCTDFYINSVPGTLQNPDIYDSIYVYDTLSVYIKNIETEGNGIVSFNNLKIDGYVSIYKSKVNFTNCISDGYFEVYGYSNSDININNCCIDTIIANQSSKIKISNTYIGNSYNNQSLVLNGGLVIHTTSTDGDLIFDQNVNGILINNLLTEDGYVSYSKLIINNVCVLNPSSNDVINLSVPYTSVILKSGGTIYASDSSVQTGFIVNILSANCSFMSEDTSPTIYIQKDNSGSSINNDEFNLFGNTYNFTDDFPISDLVKFSGLYQA